MYRLKKCNIERVVLCEAARDDLLSKGFELVEIQEESTINKNIETSKNLEEMTIEELKDYAKEKEIDIGKATSLSGILEKIKEHEAQ